MDTNEELDKLIDEQTKKNTEYKNELHRKIELIEIMMENKHIKDCNEVFTKIMYSSTESDNYKLLDKLSITEIKYIVAKQIHTTYKDLYTYLKSVENNNIIDEPSKPIEKSLPPYDYLFKLDDLTKIDNHYYLEDEKYKIRVNDLKFIYRNTKNNIYPKLEQFNDNYYYIIYSTDNNLRSKTSNTSSYISNIYIALKNSE